MRNEDRQRLDYQRSRAAQFFSKNYSREQRYLIVLSRDLKKGSDAINSLGVEKAKDFQLFYDFLLDFEKLKELMKEFRWSKELMKENGIDFQELRKLYFAVA